MKIALVITLIFVSVIHANSAEDEKILPTSGKVVINQQKIESSIVYSLSLQRPEQKNLVFWTHTVPYRETQPSDGCLLYACDEREGSVTVLIYNDETTMTLVQYGTNTKSLDVNRFSIYSQVKHQMDFAKRLQVVAPNQIIFTRHSGETQLYTVSNNTLVYPDGTPAARAGTVDIKIDKDKGSSSKIHGDSKLK